MSSVNIWRQCSSKKFHSFLVAPSLSSVRLKACLFSTDDYLFQIDVSQPNASDVIHAVRNRALAVPGESDVPELLRERSRWMRYRGDVMAGINSNTKLPIVDNWGTTGGGANSGLEKMFKTLHGGDDK